MNIISQFSVLGRIPSKKNSKWTKVIKGVPVQLSSAKYMKWEREAIKQIKELPKLQLENVYIKLDIYYPDLRRADNTNKAESIMDMLVKAKILKDDNWQVVQGPDLRGYLDRENPRAEITIYEKDN